MRLYRLEKPRYIKDWINAVIKSISISLIVVVGLMLILGYKFMIVSSGSMEPALPVGSLIVVTPCEYEDLKLGDIVTMNANGIYLTHRVKGKLDMQNKVVEIGDPRYESATWYTQGDNSDTPDGRIKPVVGKVEICLTWVGVLVRYVRANYTLLIILGVILIVFIEILHYLKSRLITDDIETYEIDEE